MSETSDGDEDLVIVGGIVVLRGGIRVMVFAAFISVGL